MKFSTCMSVNSLKVFLYQIRFFQEFEFPALFLNLNRKINLKLNENL